MADETTEPPGALDDTWPASPTPAAELLEAAAGLCAPTGMALEDAPPGADDAAGDDAEAEDAAGDAEDDAPAGDAPTGEAPAADEAGELDDT